MDLQENDLIQRVKWDSKYELGISVIDAQHKHLVELCNNLYDSIIKNQDSESWHQAVKITLQECAEYVKTHFRDEQILMQASGFQEYEAHKKRHDEFTMVVLRYVKNFDNLSLSNAIQLDQYLYEWILSHIASDDKQFAGCVKKYIESRKKGETK